MRASLQASASTSALAPRSRNQAQSFAISKIMPFQWRKKGGQWPVAGIYSTPFGKSCKPENQIIVTRDRTS
jgi:hypothetical protein